MGMDLTNGRGERFRFGFGGWAETLELARHYGWEPAGTEAPT